MNRDFMNELSKFAVFDFDGTLREGHISQFFMDELYKNALFDEVEYKLQKTLFDQHTSGKLSYSEWLDQWAISWGSAFKGYQRKDVREIAKNVFQRGKKELFISSKEIIEFFNRKNYKTVIISGGASEVIELFAEYLGVEFSIATDLESIDGVYTGRMLSETHTSEGKREYLKAFLQGHGVEEPLFVFGDSIGDQGILELAKNPIALNSDKELELIAGAKSWSMKTYKNVMDHLNSILT